MASGRNMGKKITYDCTAKTLFTAKAAENAKKNKRI